MNGIELFERIKQVSTFEDLLQSVIGKSSSKAETQSKRGNVYEKTLVYITYQYNLKCLYKF